MIRVRDLGASDFLVKPWKESEVEYRIGLILESSPGEQAA
jgi:DNA-binding response OmpR family regulator